MAVTQKANVSEAIEQRVSAITTETLIQEAVSLPTIRDFSAQVGAGMDRLDINLFNELAVQDVSESAAMTPQTIDPVAAQMSLNRHKSVPFAISDIASLQSKLALVQEAVTNGARSLAAEIDDHIFSLIDANASTRLAKTADPLADIATAKKALDLAKVPRFGRFLACSPEFIQSLLGVGSVINAEKYGASNPIQAGFVTNLFGFTLVESSSASIVEGGFQAYHQNAVAFARQMMVKFERERKVLEQRDVFAITHLYGAVATDASGVRAVVFDADGL